MADGKIYSLHIGIRKTKRYTYEEPRYTYPEAKEAAEAYAELALNNQIPKDNTLTLLNKEATRANVSKTLIRIVNKLEPYDLFFITYNGHGLAIGDSNFEKIDSKEYWALYDGIWKDDYLTNILKRAPKYTGIFFIIDSCNGPGMLNEDKINRYDDTDWINQLNETEQGYLLDHRDFKKTKTSIQLFTSEIKNEHVGNFPKYSQAILDTMQSRNQNTTYLNFNHEIKKNYSGIPLYSRRGYDNWESFNNSSPLSIIQESI